MCGWRIRDWSLITVRGATKRDEGHMKFYPFEKGGGKSLASLKGGGGGHNMFWVVFML